jgi:YegS/Rv2252/BmrU family lipid kinase
MTGRDRNDRDDMSGEFQMNEISDQWLFIINPIAGNGFAGTYTETVKEMIKKHHLNAKIVHTEKKGHATEMAAEFINKGYNHIIAVGGDGTINEIVRPIIGKSNVSMGVIAAGTGNDMIQILGFPDRFSESDWDIFFNKNMIKMDVGRCNDNFFLNGMGLGFDAKVASENYTEDGRVIEDQGSKYLWHILKNLFFYKESEMTILRDEKKQQAKCFMNTISIGRRFAGKYFLTPKALANDGLLDVCMVSKLGVLERFKIFLVVPKGTHLSNKHVDYYQTEKIKIDFDSEVPHHLDGELFYASHFEVSVLPQALNIIYNPTGPHFFRPE